MIQKEDRKKYCEKLTEIITARFAGGDKKELDKRQHELELEFNRYMK